MIKLTGKEIQVSVLHYLSVCIAQGRFEELLNAGFSPDVIDALNHMRHVDFTSITVDLGFQLELGNTRQLEHVLRGHRIRCQEQETLEELLRRGAPVMLVCNLFRRSRKEVLAVRQRVLIATLAEKLSAAQKQEVEAAWEHFKRTQAEPKSEKTFWLELSRQLQTKISTLYSAVMNYERLSN